MVTPDGAGNRQSIEKFNRHGEGVTATQEHNRDKEASNSRHGSSRRAGRDPGCCRRRAPASAAVGFGVYAGPSYGYLYRGSYRHWSYRLGRCVNFCRGCTYHYPHYAPSAYGYGPYCGGGPYYDYGPTFGFGFSFGGGHFHHH
jgi:hypothetical protein